MKNELLYRTDFKDESCLKDFFLDGGGIAKIEGGRLILDDIAHANGLTFWLNREFAGDIHIKYTAKALELSPENSGNNFNAFFMARNMDNSEIKPGEYQAGYSEYHQRSNLHIVTFIEFMDDEYTRIRVRKDPGFHLMAETKEKLNTPDHLYTLEFFIIGNSIEVKVNGQRAAYISHADIYKEGKFGFRTWRTKLEIHGLEIYAI